MRHSKLFISMMVIVLCAVLAAVALAEGTLNDLWTSGCGLLFHTDNVTVTGEASFSLDGEHFKTAQLHYVQDGYNSFYGLRLLTPRTDGSERETGWTIIAQEYERAYDESAAGIIYYVMEAYEPGLYRTGSDSAHNTLLRRSVQLDALTELGGILVGQLEPTLPEGTVAVSQAEEGNTVHIALKEDQIPELAASALNLAAGYLADRWFSYSHDRTVAEEGGASFEGYVTVTQALTDGTVRWELRSADIDFTIDAQGRMTAARGTIQAASVFRDGSVREVAVDFDLAMSDYGDSHLKPFDPADYDVKLPQEWEEENAEYLEAVMEEGA